MRAKEDKYMDFNEIKKIIEEDGGKLVIIENNKVAMVAMSYEEYQKHKTQWPSPTLSIQKREDVAQGRTESLQMQTRSLNPQPDRSNANQVEELTIDDLPL